MFCGWVVLGEEPGPGADADRTMADSLTPFEASGALTQRRSQRSCILEVRSNGARPETDHGARRPRDGLAPAATAPAGAPTDPGGVEVAGWIRLDNRRDLEGAMRGDADVDAHFDDRTLIAAGFRRWGRELIGRLEGEFSFVIWDASLRQVHLVRDSVGSRPLHYARTPWGVAFGASLASLRRIAGVDSRPDCIWVASYVTCLPREEWRSALEGVRQVPPAHVVTIAQETVQTHQYFAFDPASPWVTRRDDVRVERYREALAEAVRVRMVSSRGVGIESTGGLDSSAIVAMATHLDAGLAARLHTFSLLNYRDEIRGILATSAFVGCHHNHVFVQTPDVWITREACYTRACQVAGHPVESDPAVMHHPVYELARELGLDVLLSGFGGDEVVSNNAHALDRELLDHGVMTRTALTAAVRRPVGRIVRMVAPSRSARWTPGKNLACLVAGPVADHMRQLLVEESARSAAGRTVNEHCLNSRWGPHIARRQSESSLVAASYGLEYRWPLLDRRLISAYLATPAIEKRKGTTGRYLHRRALLGLVPDEVVWQRKCAGPKIEFRADVPTGELSRVHSIPDVLADLVDASATDSGSFHRVLRAAQWMLE